MTVALKALDIEAAGGPNPHGLCRIRILRLVKAPSEVDE